MSVKWHSNSPEFQYTCSSGAQPGRASHVRMSVSHTHGPGRQGEKHHAPSEHHHTPEQGEPTLSPSEDTKETVKGCSALWSSFTSPSSIHIHTADSGLPRWLSGKVKNPPTKEETKVQSLGWGRSPAGGNDNPLQNSCLGNLMDRGAWWATVHGVTKSQETTWQLNNDDNPADSLCCAVDTYTTQQSNYTPKKF